MSICPETSYGDQINWQCVPNCPTNINGFILDTSNLCVEQCPSPYFAFVTTRTCVIDCGAGKYGELVDRTCVDCPSTCPTCTSESSCTTCDVNMFLEFGGCVT